LKPPHIYALATVVLWSFFTPLVKLVSIKSQFLFITISFFFTFITFLAALALTQRKRLIRHLKALTWRHYVFGLFGFFLYWLTLIQCFREFSSASGSTVLNYTWPLFTVFFTEFIFRRVSKPILHRVIEWLGVFMGFAAVAVLATRGNLSLLEITHVQGLLWGLAAGAAYGLYSAYSGTVPKELHVTFLLVSAGGSLLAMLPFGLYEAGLFREFTLQDLLVVAILGSVLDAGGYFLWTSANRSAREYNVDISTVGSIVFFLPLLSVIVISLIYKETEIFKPYFGVTLFLLICGSILCQRAARIVKAFRHHAEE
jgi:drug/metabolite transporter (DMT)-like permease